MEYRKTLLTSLIGDFRAPETSSRTATAADLEQRHDGTPGFFYLKNGGKHNNYAVYSNQKLKKYAIFAK